MSKNKQPDTGERPEPDFINLERLYRVYGRFAYGLALKQFGSAQAEEIVHEVFLRFWRQDGGSTLKGPAFFGWLLREVQQMCLAASGPGKPWH